MNTAEFESVQAPVVRAGKRLEVFLITNTLETGGTERQFATLAQNLPGQDLHVRLGCLRKEGTFAADLEALEEFSPGGSLYGWRSMQARRALARHLRQNQVTVAQSFDFYSNLMMIPAARMAGTPVVIGSHRQLGDLLGGPQFWAMTTVLGFCDRVVCNSQAAAESLRKRGISSGKLAVIPNALPDAAFEMVAPALPRKAGVLRVGMVARMNDSRKNHEGFLRVAAKVAAARSNAEFVLVGDGPLRSGIEQYARSLGIAERVLFLGDRRDIPEVLAALDVSVLTSLSESLSNVIMESMAAGVPVVAGHVGGNAELVRDGATGFLVGAKDDEAFAAAVVKLLDGSEMRASFGANAKSEARSRFGVRKICALYEEMYRSVLAEKGLTAC